MTKGLISVVADDESIRRTTTFLLESFGFRAAAFESAETFLKSGQLHDTSCLIVDVQMPGMNGLELQSELAAAGYDIPIIFITAYENKVSRQQAMQAGAVAFLGKPFGDEELLQTIRSALQHDNSGGGAGAMRNAMAGVAVTGAAVAAAFIAPHALTTSPSGATLAPG